MSENIICDDIFEAIRVLEASNPAINLKDKGYDFLQRNLSFNLLEMPDGTIGAFPFNMAFLFFRGENDNYDEQHPCVPSIFRCKVPEDYDDLGKRKSDLILIDELKIIEFTLILEQYKQVIFAIQDCCKVDYRALAQHYELNTNLLDVTSDILTAAFFATHYFDSEEKTYKMKESGVGCIRSYVNIIDDYDENQPFRMIGLQPFWRPGAQCAFAVNMVQGENFANISDKILFKQSAKWNRKIHELFYCNGKNILFPDEQVANVAKKIKESKEISFFAITKFCEKNKVSQSQVKHILEKNGYCVIEKNALKLSENLRKECEMKYMKKPYGDVAIRTRMVYIPPD